MEVKTVKKEEFKELVKIAVNCLVRTNYIMYRLNETEVLVDCGNDNYKLIKNNKELTEN